MKRALPLALAALTACHAPTSTDNTASPSPKNTPTIVTERLGDYLVIPAGEEIRGSYPRLSISCSHGEPSASFDVITPPPGPTKLAGNMARLEIDARTWTVEVSNADFNNGIWSIRDDGQSDDLSAKILAAKVVKFRAPDGQGPSEAIEFQLSPTVPAVSTFREQCAKQK
ncbi:hypothetical protein ACVOMT_11540 [Sphingomonas panni]